jgi:hypothetical protein
MRSPQPSLALMTTFSDSSLEGFELARLDEISQLRRKVQEIHEEWIEAEVAAHLARLLLEARGGHHSVEPDAVVLLGPHTCSQDSTAPSPSLQDLHLKTKPDSLLPRPSREEGATRAFGGGEPVANLAFAPATPSVHAPKRAASSLRVPGERPCTVGSSPLTESAASASSRRVQASRSHATPKHQPSTLASAKLRSTMPFRPGASLQLPLFAETQPTQQSSERSRFQPASHLPTRPILYLTQRRRVPVRPSFSLREYPAAS